MLFLVASHCQISTNLAFPINALMLAVESFDFYMSITKDFDLTQSAIIAAAMLSIACKIEV
jgi:hypothetical protein